MKVTLNEFSVPEEVGTKFEGLVLDQDGDVWVFGREFAIVLTDECSQFLDMTKVEAVMNNTFTKFVGKITLENN